MKQKLTKAIVQKQSMVIPTKQTFEEKLNKLDNDLIDRITTRAFEIKKEMYNLAYKDQNKVNKYDVIVTLKAAIEILKEV